MLPRLLILLPVLSCTATIAQETEHEPRAIQDYLGEVVETRGDWEPLPEFENEPTGIQSFQMASGQDNGTAYRLDLQQGEDLWLIEDYLDFRRRPLFVQVFRANIQSGLQHNAHLHGDEWQLHYEAGQFRRLVHYQHDGSGTRSGPTVFTQKDFEQENTWHLIDEIPLRVRRLAELLQDYEYNTLMDMLHALPGTDSPRPVPPAPSELEREG